MIANFTLGRMIYILVFSGCYFYLTYGLEQRLNRWFNFLVLSIALLLLYQPTNSTLLLTLFRYVKFAALYSVWSMIFLRIRPSYAIYLSVFYTVFMGVCFSCVQIVFQLLGLKDNTLLTFCTGICRVAAIFLLKKYFLQIDGSRAPTFHEAILGLFPAVACFAANLVMFDYLIAQHTGMSGEYRTLLYLLALFFAFSAMVVLISSEQYFTMNRYKEENERAKQQLSEQYRLFLKEEENTDRMKALYHDMKNHLLAIQGMENTEAQSYIQDLQKSLDELTPAYVTGCSTLDALLMSKKTECDRQGIQLTSYVHLTKYDFVSPMEICTLFGNCLDNAIEAVSDDRIQEKYIHISGGEVNDNMVITVRNPFAHELKRKNEGFETTKSSTEYHGYGLMNIRGVVERHGGTITFQTENDQFLVCWMIPIPKK